MPLLQFRRHTHDVTVGSITELADHHEEVVQRRLGHPLVGLRQRHQESVFGDQGEVRLGDPTFAVHGSDPDPVQAARVLPHDLVLALVRDTVERDDLLGRLAVLPSLGMTEVAPHDDAVGVPEDVDQVLDAGSPVGRRRSTVRGNALVLVPYKKLTDQAAWKDAFQKWSRPFFWLSMIVFWVWLLESAFGSWSRFCPMRCAVTRRAIN